MDTRPAHKFLEDSVALLQRLIAAPSFSRDEAATADIWQQWLGERVGDVRRFHNNIYTVAPGFDPARPTLMLNSHHDTVKPSSSYTRDPFRPEIVGDRLYGLGSNDAGASGVALAATFIGLQDCKDLRVNLLLAITAEEEVSGENGMRAFLPHLREQGFYPDMAIVGEPTGMCPAVAERGLLVFDAVAAGKSGHAARSEGINAIYRAIEDINRLREFRTERVSDVLGPIKVSVTMIDAGTQHNVVPDSCCYVIDVRTTDAYTNEETVELLRRAVRWSMLTPRSTRIHASVIDEGHPLVAAAKSYGHEPFVSPTTSDMALIPDIDSLKIGPGQSSRSHSADEFICISEINEALYIYPEIIKAL